MSERSSIVPRELAVQTVARGRAWVQRLGLLGLISVVLTMAVADFALAIRVWASVPLTIVETLLLAPWLAMVLRREPADAASPGWAPALRARLPHVANIALVLLTMGEKWRLLVGALVAETPHAFVPGYRALSVVALLAVIVGIVGRGQRAQAFLADAADHPARLMVLSFAIASFLGAFCLSLPVAVTDVRHLSFVDALFTAVSAVCVTGLAVNDVAETYTPFGEGVILVLAQIGGLGIMVLSASFAVLAGRKLRVKQSAVLAEMIDASSLSMLRRALLWIVGYTLFFEAIGAATLYGIAAVAHPEIAAAPGDRVYWAVFHSVMAFCNAGFALMPGNLSSVATSWPLNLTFAALITIGGIGFPVIEELRQQLWERLRRRRPRRMSLHARVVLATSAALSCGAAAAILAAEWSHSLAHLPWHARVLAAMFQSISMRTAGFNTIDLGAMRTGTLLLACIVMFIGASPGSAGGGIKTTTLAAIFAEFRAEMRGSPHARLFDRELVPSVVRRATGIVFLALVVVLTASIALLFIEDQEPLAIVFEVVSAAATVGLSTGITPELSNAGKLIVALVMFVGRIGPLTMALAMSREAQQAPVRPASERMMVG